MGSLGVKFHESPDGGDRKGHSGCDDEALGGQRAHKFITVPHPDKIRPDKFLLAEYTLSGYLIRMRLTKKGEYALRVMIRLGVAQRLGREVVSVSALAEVERLPFKFLEQILNLLRLEGYLQSRRGKLGGAMLAKPMEEIRIGEIVRLIDGRLAPIGCASETDYEKCTCPDEQHCGLRMIMIDVRNAVSRILDRYTLADVVGVTLRKMERDGVLPMQESVSSVKVEDTTTRRADPEEGFLNWITETPITH